MKSKNFGFTIFEVLVAITLSILVLGGLYGVYVTSVQSYRRSTAQAELSQNARIALERISRDLRQTQRIVTELPTDDTDPLNPPPSAIQFQDGHNTTQIQYIRYYLSGQELRQQFIHYYFSTSPDEWVAWNAQDEDGNPPQESATEVVKADKITSLKFYGDKLITIDLTTTYDTATFAFKTKILGRNIK